MAAPVPTNIKYFKTQQSFREWLEKYHAKKDELWLGYYKKGSGKKVSLIRKRWRKSFVSGGLTVSPAA